MQEVRAAGIDKVDAGQAVLLGDLLRPQVLFHSKGKVGAALHGRIVGDDHDLAARHPSDTGDQACAGRLAVIETEPGKLADFEERGQRVEQARDALAGRKLAPRDVPAAALLGPAQGGLGRAAAQCFDKGAVMGASPLERVGAGVDGGVEPGRRQKSDRRVEIRRRALDRNRGFRAAGAVRRAP